MGTRVTQLVIAAALAFALGGCRAESPDITSTDQAQRLAALRRLQQEDSDPALEKAAQTIMHEDIVTARAAVQTVSRMSHRGALKVLAHAAGEDPRPEIRHEAALALSYAPESASADVLRKTVDADPEACVRSAAAIGVGRVGDLSDVPRLLRVAERDPDPVVQMHAIGALEQILGIGFTYNPRAPEEERRLTLERVRDAANIRAAVLRERQANKAGKGGGS